MERVVLGLGGLGCYMWQRLTIPISGWINGTASGMASLMDVRITHHYAMWFIIVGSYFISIQIWRTYLGRGGYCHSLWWREICQ